jgi:hypothetical protein
MKSILYHLARAVKRRIWAMIVAYMLGMHNFYTGENKTRDDISIKIEYNQVQEEGEPE